MSVPLFLKKDDGTKDSVGKWSRCLEYEITISKVKTKFGGFNALKPTGTGNLHAGVLK